MLPASSPLKCMSPADVYLVLKSSDFVQHDLSADHVFEGCETASSAQGSTSPTLNYELELVLRKWYPVDQSRELRCFVRQEVLLGTSNSSPIQPSCDDNDPSLRHLTARPELLRILERIRDAAQSHHRCQGLLGVKYQGSVGANWRRL